jgi:hypothetical protein
MDNVITSSFYSSELEKINCPLVLTDDAVAALQKNFVWINGNDQNPTGGTEPTGQDRFEGVLDTTIDRDSDGDDIDDLSDAQILAIIQSRGEDVIRENTPVGIFEGDFDTRGIFVYGEDFFMGDIIQCIIHGQEVAARVIELVRSYSVEGEKVYIAFDFLV